MDWLVETKVSVMLAVSIFRTEEKVGSDLKGSDEGRALSRQGGRRRLESQMESCHS
jgi:hypothetical protein